MLVQLMEHRKNYKENPKVVGVCAGSLELDIEWIEKGYDQIEDITLNLNNQTVIHVQDTQTNERIRVTTENMTYRDEGLKDIMLYCLKRSLTDTDFDKKFFKDHVSTAAAKRTKEIETFKMDAADYLTATDMEFAKRRDEGKSNDTELMPIKNLPP